MEREEELQLFALLTRGVDALEKQNTQFQEWTDYQKEQGKKRHDYDIKIAHIQQTHLDTYQKQCAATEQDYHDALEQARSLNTGLLEFLSEREARMMQAIDSLCERTAVAKPDWNGIAEKEE